MVERRAGGESGVKWLQAYRGDNFWDALREGRWSRRLMVAALCRSHTLTPARESFNDILPTDDDLRRLVKDPIAYHYEHADGLICTMILFNGLVKDFNFAADVDGRRAPWLRARRPDRDAAHRSGIVRLPGQGFAALRGRFAPPSAAQPGLRRGHLLSLLHHEAARRARCLSVLGTACYIKGAGALLNEAQAALGIQAGETTPDAKAPLMTARCIGSCSVAPAVVFDGETIGEASPERPRKAGRMEARMTSRNSNRLPLKRARIGKNRPAS